MDQPLMTAALHLEPDATFHRSSVTHE